MAYQWTDIWIESWRERTLEELRSGRTTPEYIRERFRSPILAGIKKGMEAALAEFERENATNK